MRRMSTSLKYCVAFVLLAVLTAYASPQRSSGRENSQRNKQRGNINNGRSRNSVASSSEPIVTTKGITDNGDEVCDEPPSVIDEATLVAEEESKYSVGTVIRYACDSKFKSADHEGTSQCKISENGTPEWTAPIIKCPAVDCGDPGTVQNSQRSGSTFTLNSRVTFKCDEGYVLIGKETIECSSSGNWTGSLPSCEITEVCDKPPLLNGLKVVNEDDQNYPVGSIATYTCDFGYLSDTVSANSECVLSSQTGIGEWTAPDIHCSPRSCGDPGVMLNGHRSGSLFTFGNSVTYECDDGYYIKGRDTRFCMISGLWSGELASCEKTMCPIPRDPDNGKASYSSLVYGSTIEYECDFGFSLDSTETRFCLLDGTWSGDEPLCKETSECEPLAVPKHGTLIYTTISETKVGSIALFACDPGYTLIGSATSKCFKDIGWTFPTPKCAEKCSVPEIDHGEILELKYDWRNKESLKKVSVGTAIDASKEYILICEHRYEPMGESKGRVKISCVNGEWLKTPECLPAKCRSSPPDTPNGSVRQPLQREHGKVVVYNCYANFNKTKTGNVTCRNGQWTGATPICEDTRCYLSHLGYPGLVHGQQKVFNHGASFYPTCKEGHDVSEPNRNFQCLSGEWDGPHPPCRPASCSQYPPSTPFGSANPFDVVHTSMVSYSCDEGYLQVAESTVYCNFGQWKGEPAICKDSRCHFKNINETSGINPSGKDVLLDGDQLGFVCSEGFDFTGSKVFCTNGEWTFENDLPPCKARNCKVHSLNYGKFTKKIQVRNNFQTKQINLGEVVEHSVKIFVTCDDSFTLGGKFAQEGQVTCVYGQWSPLPLCSKPGRGHEDRYRQDGTVRESNKDQKQKPEITFPKLLSPTAIIQTITSAFLPSPEVKSKKEDDSCFCKYQNNDDRVIAHAGSELLKRGSLVSKGFKVKFHCNNFGYDRLRGPSELECKDCKPWRSMVLPKCETPQYGDSIVKIVSGIQILPGGTLAIESRANARILCYLKDEYRFQPRWSVPISQDIHPAGTKDRYGMPITLLDIINANSFHSGKYTCQPLPNKNAMEVRIEVIDHIRCQKFQEDGKVIAHYDNNLQVNSNVVFTCVDRSLKIAGRDFLTCAEDGSWSGSRPRCVVMCPELSRTEGMDHITYSKELEVGSNASFHCTFPRELLLDNFSLTCLINGEWSGQVPTCSLPPCDVETLSGILKDDLALDESQNAPTSESYAIGQSLRLKCKNENLTISGTPFAKCSEDSKWKVDENTMCQTGCHKIVAQDSRLKIDPSKEFYSIGDIISLSCPPGKKIRNNIEQLMCHTDGWSETELDCMESDESSSKGPN